MSLPTYGDGLSYGTVHFFHEWIDTLGIHAWSWSAEDTGKWEANFDGARTTGSAVDQEAAAIEAAVWIAERRTEFLARRAEA